MQQQPKQPFSSINERRRQPGAPQPGGGGGAGDARSKPPPVCTVEDQDMQVALAPGVFALMTTSWYPVYSPSSRTMTTFPPSRATASSNGWSLALLQVSWRARLPLVGPTESGEKSDGPGLQGGEMWEG